MSNMMNSSSMFEHRIYGVSWNLIELMGLVRIIYQANIAEVQQGNLQVKLVEEEKTLI